jgi:hypothetical protein
MRIVGREVAVFGPPSPLEFPPEVIEQEVRDAGYDLSPRDIPRWLRALTQKDASPREILEVLARRLVGGQSDVEEALIIANDLGRRPANARLIKSMLTDELHAKISERAAREGPG